MGVSPSAMARREGVPNLTHKAYIPHTCVKVNHWKVLPQLVQALVEVSSASHTLQTPVHKPPSLFPALTNTTRERPTITHIQDTAPFKHGSTPTHSLQGPVPAHKSVGAGKGLQTVLQLLQGI